MITGERRQTFRRIRILHLEDSTRDQQYVEDLLDSAGVPVTLTPVATRAAFEAALVGCAFDLILCDFSLPDLDGLAALRLAKTACPAAPVIMVSGAIHPEVAVACLQQGATDLLLKDRLERLPSAIQRAVDERARRALLRDVEQRFQTMADQSPTGYMFLETNPDRIIYASRAIAELHGLSRETILRDAGSLRMALLPDDREKMDVAWLDWVAHPTPQLEQELRVQRPDGTIRWLQLTITRVTDDDGHRTRYHCIIQDATERKAMEVRMQQAQKMEVVGRLAGGIAHDFNNLLTVISGSAELALAQGGTPDAVRQDLQEIHSASVRGAALVAQLMAFSRQQILRPRVLDPAILIRNLDSLLERLIGGQLQVVQQVAPEVGRIRVDPGQLEQVLVNLVVNARDAMPQGGTLTIAVDATELDDAEATRLSIATGPYVRLTVADTGQGMTDEVRRRAFEPFFTTKGTEGGTGLGLSTVYGIVQQSGGTVVLTSTLGVGTTFALYFPRVAEAAEAVPALTAAAMAAGTETVLVVDDDPALRALIRRMLTSAGYTVIVAEDGPTALSILAALERKVDLLLTDMVMPTMTGQELGERCRAVRPGMRVMYMSGFTEDEVAHRNLRNPDIAFLAKPFTAASLTRGVRDALQG